MFIYGILRVLTLFLLVSDVQVALLTGLNIKGKYAVIETTHQWLIGVETTGVLVSDVQVALLTGLNIKGKYAIIETTHQCVLIGVETTGVLVSEANYFLNKQGVHPESGDPHAYHFKL